MLDPESDAGIEPKLAEGLKLRQKLTILTNGIFAASRMLNSATSTDLEPLNTALQKLVDSDQNRAIRTKAKEAIIVLRRHGK